MLPVIGEIRPWADPTVLQLNRLAMHVPMSGFHRCSLDGHWSLELFDSPDAVPAEALEGERPRAATVAAPGNWTVQYLSSPCGPAFVDTPHYTNTQMPFGGPPPRVPVRNPTGVYRRPFTVPAGWMQRRAVLHISGAESLHAGYVNGRFVGYGTDSRLPSEYDVGAVPGCPTATSWRSWSCGTAPTATSRTEANDSGTRGPHRLDRGPTATPHGTHFT